MTAYVETLPEYEDMLSNAPHRNPNGKYDFPDVVREGEVQNLAGW